MSAQSPARARFAPLTLMPQAVRSHQAQMAVLHPAFSLTGLLHASGGALLPSIAARLQLTDKQSGLIFLLYFVGTSVGALLCTRAYARISAMGFLLVAVCSCAIAYAPAVLLGPLFMLLGVGVGVPMSAVSIIAGRHFRERSAAPLTLLNLSWSAGALAAPLLAGAFLLHHSYSIAYLAFAIASCVAAAACFLVLRDTDDLPAVSLPSPSSHILGWVVLIAFLTFLEVGVENTSVTWLATFALRTSAASGFAHAALSSSLYWIGFLVSRGVSSWLLLRVPPLRILTLGVVGGIAGSAVLITQPGVLACDIGMALLGAALAPIFPLLLAQFFARVANTSHARWVLACCGLGGSVLPWITGAVSTSTGSLRLGLLVVPAALLVLLCCLPVLRGRNLAQT